MAYQSTKTYGNDRGFSCAFRQWSADSHCNLIHGYALQFEFLFGGEELDEPCLRSAFDDEVHEGPDDALVDAILKELGIFRDELLEGDGRAYGIGNLRDYTGVDPTRLVSKVVL